jgi:hypothetical protein
MRGSAKRPSKSETKKGKGAKIGQFANGQKIGQKIVFSAENYVIIITYTTPRPAKNMTAESPQRMGPTNHRFFKGPEGQY